MEPIKEDGGSGMSLPIPHVYSPLIFTLNIGLRLMKLIGP